VTSSKKCEPRQAERPDPIGSGGNGRTDHGPTCSSCRSGIEVLGDRHREETLAMTQAEQFVAFANRHWTECQSDTEVCLIEDDVFAQRCLWCGAMMQDRVDYQALGEIGSALAINYATREMVRQ
jgi:hypothetical protein